MTNNPNKNKKIIPLKYRELDRLRYDCCWLSGKKFKVEVLQEVTQKKILRETWIFEHVENNEWKLYDACYSKLRDRYDGEIIDDSFIPEAIKLRAEKFLTTEIRLTAFSISSRPP